MQGWDESQAQREFFASLLGSGTRFEAHAASKQSVIALVGAGYGITLAAKSQAEVKFPKVVFRPVVEPNAWLRIDLAWMPEAEDPAVGVSLRSCVTKRSPAVFLMSCRFPIRKHDRDRRSCLLSRDNRGP